MADLKLKFGKTLLLEEGTLGFDYDWENGSLDYPVLTNIYVDLKGSEEAGVQRFNFGANRLIDTANGDALDFSGTGIDCYTTNNDISFNCTGGHRIGNFKHGLELKANYDGQYVIGQYNRNYRDSIIEIGNGTANDKRSNLLRVTTDGKIQLGDIDISYLHFNHSNLEFREWHKSDDGSFAGGSDGVNINAQGIFIDDSTTYETKLIQEGLVFQEGSEEMIFRIDSIQHQQTPTEDTIGIYFSSTTITLDATSSSDGEIDLLSPGYLRFETGGGFYLSADGSYASNPMGVISVSAMSGDEIATLSLIASNDGTGKTTSITLTEEKIQFNCDRDNIVDKNNNKIFSANEIILPVGQKEFIIQQTLIDDNDNISLFPILKVTHDSSSDDIVDYPSLALYSTHGGDRPLTTISASPSLQTKNIDEQNFKINNNITLLSNFSGEIRYMTQAGVTYGTIILNNIIIKADAQMSFNLYDIDYIEYLTNFSLTSATQPIAIKQYSSTSQSNSWCRLMLTPTTSSGAAQGTFVFNFIGYCTNV